MKDEIKSNINNLNNVDLERNIKMASDIIKNNGVVIFPTETVYGIGCNALNEKAVKKIYDIKNRPYDNPINILVNDVEMIEFIAKDISPIEYLLIDKFLPGPLTLILKKKDIVPDIVTAGSDMVGVRIPDNTIARKLLDYSNTPLATPSANASGKLSGTTYMDVFNEFNENVNVDYIIDGGDCDIGIESTIVQVIDGIPHILRPGAITPSQIKAVCGDVVNEADIDNNQKENVLLPSSNKKHYQLSSKSILVYSNDNNKMVSEILNVAFDYSNPCIICFDENSNSYDGFDTVTIGTKSNLENISKNLFSILRKVDNLNYDIVIIEGLEKKDLGIAIMNRLINICDFNYIEI